MRATSQEEAEGRAHHIAPVAAQTEHVQTARANPELRASSNHGKPPIAATEKPGAFKESGAVAAKEGGTVHTANENNNAHPNNESSRPETGSNRPPVENTRPAPAVHAKDIPPAQPHAAPNTGNAKNDMRFQQQQQKLDTKQVKEQQNLAAKQEHDHQRLPQKPANEPKQQPLEQKHQQQTQQLEQKHTQQQQQLQQHQQPASHGAPPPKQQTEKGKPS